jgi:hypothetical protein
LYLQATCGGLYPFAVPLGEGGWRKVLGMSGLLDKTPAEVTALLVEKSFSKEFLEQDGKRARLEQEMQNTFQRRFSWTLDTLAQQSPISATFHFSSVRLLALRHSGVPIVVRFIRLCLFVLFLLIRLLLLKVHVQAEDQAMPTAKQFDLAKNLSVEPVVFLGGHMEADARERDRFSAALSENLQKGEAFSLSASVPLAFSAIELRALQTVWVRDVDRVGCKLCQKEFTLLTRRHHCRFCGEIFCADCSQGRVKLPFHQDEERVCTTCSQELIQQRE